jgi:hypothetical protein
MKNIVMQDMEKSYAWKALNFLRPWGSLPGPQEVATGYYLKSAESSLTLTHTVYSRPILL